MLTAVKLVDQWSALERRLPPDWESAGLRLRAEQRDELAEAARILGPMGVARSGDDLLVTVRRAGGPSGPVAARRLFARLDAGRIWCLLDQDEVVAAPPAMPDERPAGRALAAAWDDALAALPADWTDLLCAIDLESSALLPRAALLCAPLTPTRDHARIGFVFRSASRGGYGASPKITRRCFERLDDEAIDGRVTVLHAQSDTDNVATQGLVWYVGGKAL
jgi:hypothetical protein